MVRDEKDRKGERSSLVVEKPEARKLERTVGMHSPTSN